MRVWIVALACVFARPLAANLLTAGESLATEDAAALQAAVDAGTPFIVASQHMDFQPLKNSVDCGQAGGREPLLCVLPETRSIQGNCSQAPPALGGAPLLGLKPRQCVLRMPVDAIHITYPAQQVYLDSLYIRADRGFGATFLRMVYIDSPTRTKNDDITKVWMERVTLQGDGGTAIQGLFVEQSVGLYAQDSQFSDFHTSTGSVMRLAASSAYFVRSSFLNSSTTQTGAAVQLLRGGKAAFQGCSFASNWPFDLASDSAGQVYSDTGTPEVQDPDGAEQPILLSEVDPEDFLGVDDWLLDTKQNAPQLKDTPRETGGGAAPVAAQTPLPAPVPAPEEPADTDPEGSPEEDDAAAPVSTSPPSATAQPGSDNAPPGSPRNVERAADGSVAPPAPKSEVEPGTSRGLLVGSILGSIGLALAAGVILAVCTVQRRSAPGQFDLNDWKTLSPLSRPTTSPRSMHSRPTPSLSSINIHQSTNPFIKAHGAMSASSITAQSAAAQSALYNSAPASPLTDPSQSPTAAGSYSSRPPLPEGTIPSGVGANTEAIENKLRELEVHEGDTKSEETGRLVQTLPPRPQGSSIPFGKSFRTIPDRSALNDDGPRTPRSLLAHTLNAMERSGTQFQSKFNVLGEKERVIGSRSVVQFMTWQRYKTDFAVKFFFDRAGFAAESDRYNNPVISKLMPKLHQVSANEDGRISFMEDESLDESTRFKFPPFIIVERGESLEMWLRHVRQQSINDGGDVRPEFASSLQALVHVAKLLRQLHGSGWVHRNISPKSVLRMARSPNAWALLDFKLAAPVGKLVPATCNAQYGSPEVMQADENNQKSVVAECACDVWALGLLAVELITGERATHGFMTPTEARSRIMGRAKMPWEDPVDGPELVAKLGPLKATVLACLSREPGKRPMAREMVHTWSRIHDSEMAKSMSSFNPLATTGSQVFGTLTGAAPDTVTNNPLAIEE